MSNQQIIDYYSRNYGHGDGLMISSNDLKEFIEEVKLDKAHQKSCNGVSQWMNFGKEKGYWKFFEAEVRDEIQSKLPNEKEDKSKVPNDPWYATYKTGFNDCLKQIKESLN